MTTKTTLVASLVALPLGCVLFPSCSAAFGRQYAAVKVTSVPPGAAVYSMMEYDSAVDGKTNRFAKDRLGTTPTGVLAIWFSTRAPGGGKVGVRIMMDGYEPYDILLEAGDWYDTEEEARRHVKELAVTLKRKGPASESSEQQDADQHTGTPATQPAVNTAASHITRTLRNWTCEVPLTWQAATRADEDQMRSMLTPGLPTGCEIAALFVFTAGSDGTFLIYELALSSSGGAKYIDSLKSQNEEKFRMGRSQGLVKDVLENRTSRIGTCDALLVDWESNRGELPHSRQWVLHNAQRPDSVVVLTAFCNTRGYEVTKDALDSAASSAGCLP